MKFFELGNGHSNVNVPKEWDGFELANFTDPECKCGYGCAIGECKKSERHWFQCPDATPQATVDSFKKCIEFMPTGK